MRMFLNLLLTLFYFGLCNSQRFIADQNLSKIYYKIPAEKNLKIPFVMSKEIDYFEVYSERNAFQFEVVISERKQKICKEEHENPNDDVFSLPSFCRHKLVNLFSHNIIYKIFMFPDAFDFPDILKYNGFTFTEFIINNTGHSDFYVREYIKPGSNAPISLLNRCGINNRRLIQEGRIEADPKDWPWMAAILKNKDSDLICWRVLITDRHVLAASSCFRNKSKDEVKIRLGEYNVQKPNEDSLSDIRIERIMSTNTSDGGIALAKLERPTSFSKFISPVCLPPRSETLETRNGIFVGWGTIPDNNFSYILEERTIQIWRKRDCEAAIPSFTFADNMFCAGLRRELCRNAVIGNIFIQEPDLYWHVSGILYWDLTCIRDSPSVFINVSYYLDWIQNNMET
ncbi:UNVERIFIED_CONTAM: hypothetical protein RMT77_001864 [Armadillidium vulgare]